MAFVLDVQKQTEWFESIKRYNPDVDPKQLMDQYVAAGEYYHILQDNPMAESLLSNIEHHVRKTISPNAPTYRCISKDGFSVDTEFPLGLFRKILDIYQETISVNLL